MQQPPKVIADYKRIMIDGLKHTFKGIDSDQLSRAIDWSINKNMYDGKVTIDNNYDNTKINTTVTGALNLLEELQPIMTSSGVLFKKHKDTKNPLNDMIQGFLSNRVKYKKEMFKYPKGTADFERYNLLQLLEKLNANATYGCLGAPTSMYYNVYVAEAITRQGRCYISCSIMLFESLLANNVKFNSLNEIIMFINNVEHERPNRKFDDKFVLDRDITKAECFYKLISTVDYSIWVPNEQEMQLVWDYISDLDQEDINRIYYKNNIYVFCDNPVISNLLLSTLGKLDEPFMDPNKPPQIIKEDLDMLVDYVKEYVYYPYIYVDKLDRIDYMQRDVVIICDTDSTIISFDAWYRFLLNKTIGKKLSLLRRKYNMVDILEHDEDGNKKKRIMCEIVEPRLDYDFYTDETIELGRYLNPVKLAPNDSLRYSIINIIAYICSKLVVDYLNVYCDKTNSTPYGSKPCHLVMKNEFYFLRALLTEHKRNYASYNMRQEGNIVPEHKRLSIAGLPIDKSTLPSDIKQAFKNILVEDVMTAITIDQVAIMKKLILLENTVYNSIMNKETKYYKPDNVAPMNSYAAPLSTNGVVACLVYNELRSPTMPIINLEERNYIIKIKIDVSKKNIEKIKDKYPEEYEKLSKLLMHPTLGAKINTIALPLDVQVPDWVLEFVDFTAIISDYMKNFPTSSVGLHSLNNDSINYSNIIKL